MKIIVSHPSIAPHIKQTVVAYHKAGWLKYFYTAFFEHPKYSLSNFLSRFGSLKSLISRRKFHELPIEKFISRPFPELLRSFSARKINPLVTDRVWEWAELGFDKWVASSLLKNEIDIVHTYEHAALATLQMAVKLNIFTVYEQSSQHHLSFLRMANKQFSCYPDLNSKATDLLINKKAKRRNKRRDEELSIADLIICNSTFTKKTLTDAGVNPERISVVPLGFPPVNRAYLERKKEDKCFVFMYAGNQSISKGSHLLYEAWRKCNFPPEVAKLVLIGKMNLPEKTRENLPGNVSISNNIPHSELMELYKTADVFLLPTLGDGFGMVVTEAMSNGVPVIATTNCCGPDIITHMKDGWIIPPDDVDALIEQMRWCITHESDLVHFKNASIKKASEWQWSDYRNGLLNLINEKWLQSKKKQFV
ncbi:D-inositol 3-phosphate glycosyltransferase [compost metagenome]